MPTSSDDVLSLVRQLTGLLQKLNVQDKTLTGQALPSTDQLQQLADLLTKILPVAKPLLGQVNGALGQTIGNLLNGKKSAIGVIGALATSLLSAVPSGSGLGQIFGYDYAGSWSQPLCYADLPGNHSMGRTWQA